MEFSKRAKRVQPSATLAVGAEAKRMQAAGIDVINLSTGEPDFTTPKNIQQAAIASIQNGTASYYTPVTGLPELKAAIVKHINQKYPVQIDSNQVIATVGAKMGLYGLFQTLLNPGDGVILIAPYWVSYEEQIQLADGATQVIYPKATDFKVTVAELEATRSAQTKLLVLNSPQNPSGVIYSKSELIAIGEWALKNNILVISDEIYGSLVYNGNQFTSMLELAPEIIANTIVVDGVSKSYSMTGWRIGYLVGNAELLAKVGALLGHMTSNPTTVAQYATMEALNGPQDSVEQMRQAFEQRLNQTYDSLVKVPGFKIPHKPGGAFYLFIDVRTAMQKKGFKQSTDFTMALLKEGHVAVVAGEAFGMPGYIRISYANSLENLNQAVQRIQKFME